MCGKVSRKPKDTSSSIKCSAWQNCRTKREVYERKLTKGFIRRRQWDFSDNLSSLANVYCLSNFIIDKANQQILLSTLLQKI